MQIDFFEIFGYLEIQIQKFRITIKKTRIFHFYFFKHSLFYPFFHSSSIFKVIIFQKLSFNDGCTDSLWSVNDFLNPKMISIPEEPKKYLLIIILENGLKSIYLGTPCVMFIESTPAKWNVLSVIWVPGSPILCAQRAPTAVPENKFQLAVFKVNTKISSWNLAQFWRVRICPWRSGRIPPIDQQLFAQGAFRLWVKVDLPFCISVAPFRFVLLGSPQRFFERR